MIWFDHVVWCMIHNLDIFFPAKGHLCSKYAALIGWLETAAREAVKASIAFAHLRSLMIEGALEFATNPKNKLLTKYGDGLGIQKIERMIRPSTNAGLGQTTHLSFKRALPDLNHDSGNPPHKRAYNAGRGHGFAHHRPSTQSSGRGHGFYNNNGNRRFGSAGSTATGNLQNGNVTVHNISHTSDNTREMWLHNIEPQYGDERSSGGSSTSTATISSPIFGRNINWD